MTRIVPGYPGADGLKTTSMWAQQFAQTPVVNRFQQGIGQNAAMSNGAMEAIERILAQWPEKPREAYAALVAKYGPPDEVIPSRMFWYRRGPWARTILYRDEVPHDWPQPHVDIVEQTIFYRTPVEAFTALAKFDGSVFAERTKGILSARCGGEDMNFLAVNLANDIATGRLSADEAREAYVEAVVAYMAGERPPYTQGLAFQPAMEYTGDLDTAVI